MKKSNQRQRSAKLKLSRETVRTLADGDLDSAAGGWHGSESGDSMSIPASPRVGNLPRNPW